MALLSSVKMVPAIQSPVVSETTPMGSTAYFAPKLIVVLSSALPSERTP